MHLIVVVLAELFHRRLDIVVFGVLEIVVYLFFLVRIDHLFDEVIDIDLRAAEHDRLQFVHHLLHAHSATLGKVVQINTAVDGLDDLFLTGRFLRYRTDTHVVRTDDLVLIHVLFDDTQELFAVPFGFCHTHTRDRQQLFHRDGVGGRHGFQTRVLEDHERRYVALLRYLTTDILQDREQHLIGCGTGSACTIHIHLVLVMHLDRHLELTRLADELKAVFLQLQIAVGIDIFLDHTHEQRLTQDRVQRALLHIAGSTEIVQLVMMITHHFGGLVAVQDINDMFCFVVLVHLLDRLQRDLQQLTRIHLLVGLAAVVAVAAFVLRVLLAEIVQQQLTAADRALRITLRLEQQLVTDTDLFRGLVFLEAS